MQKLCTRKSAMRKFTISEKVEKMSPVLKIANLQMQESAG